MAEFMGNSFSFHTEKHLENLNQRINSIENKAGRPMSKSVHYDPNVAKANPVPNLSAVGTKITPQQGKQFQAMMQIMQANMLSSGIGDNDNKKGSGLESMMQNMMGIPQGASMPNIPGMGMQMPNQPGMGMNAIDPEILQQMSKMQMMNSF